MSAYGCKNRAPLRTQVVVQSGHFMDGYTRTPKIISIPDPMTKDCQYSKDDKYNDSGCVGCVHKQERRV